jgi:UDP-N-acetylmuramoyl-L-alanyl-D-glutamate--2,6-diaminopimelate ligase
MHTASKHKPGNPSLSSLLRAVEGAVVSGSGDPQITGLAYDSRRVAPGHLFIAVRGEVTDGNLYIAQAAERGAAAIVSELAPTSGPSVPWVRIPDARLSMAALARAYYQDPSRELSLVGVTGTKGKTTTTYLVDSVLEVAGKKTCRIGTIDYRLGDETWSAARTTPEAVDLQALLRKAVDGGCTHAVMEVSSHSLALHRVRGSCFEIACFTNLSRDHLDYHTDFENYFRAKQMLFLGGEVDGPKLAVVNVSDSWGKRLRQSLTCSTLTFGLIHRADVRPEVMPENLNPLRFAVQTDRGNLRIDSRLVGMGNLFNILSTVAICQGLGLKSEAIEEGINRLQGVPGRLELIDCGQPFTVIVDYAHTDVALENLLLIARGLHPRRIITLFGCGGNRDRSKRPLMGEIAAKLSDLVIVTSDNPRGEEPAAIIAEIEKGIRTVTSRYQRIVDREEAIATAFRQAQPDDVVLVAGKGHETYQECAGHMIPFDDREMCRKLLKKKMEGTL